MKGGVRVCVGATSLMQLKAERWLDCLQVGRFRLLTAAEQVPDWWKCKENSLDQVLQPYLQGMREERKKENDWKVTLKAV